MAFTAETRGLNGARRISERGTKAVARAVVEGQRLWSRRAEPKEQHQLRWALAILLVLVGLASAVVIPRADASTEPTFDSAVAASIDPPDAMPAATAQGPVAAPIVQPVNVPLPLKPTVPVGKGMWVHQLDRASAGDIAGMVKYAVDTGLTHIYVRLGSSKKGFYAQRDLDAILPLAHKAGLKIVGWDYPYLFDAIGDANRAGAEIAYRTPDGHGIDAFAADIETQSEGTNLTIEGVKEYNIRIREVAGFQFPLIAAVPRPSPSRWFPYPEATRNFDAIAPMVYWVNRDPATDVARAIAAFHGYNKPILPVGQAYDPAVDGSQSWAPPSADDLHRFMRTAGDLGVASYSFWAWDTASPEQWDAIATSNLVDLKPLVPGPNVGDRVAALQRVLKGLGRNVTVDGDFGAGTKAALEDLQRQLGVPVTGVLDAATLQALKAPRG